MTSLGIEVTAQAPRTFNRTAASAEIDTRDDVPCE